MIQITDATISNVLLDDLMLWLSNVYLSSPKSRDFDDSTTVRHSLHMQLVAILKQGRSTKIAGKSRIEVVEV